MAYEKRYTKVKRKNVIIKVKKDSIAEEIGIEKGYSLLKINGHNIVDILDYKFYICDEYIEIEVMNLDGKIETCEIEKDEEEDLGIEFESELIDEAKNCHNKCIFCFMNQLPKEVRDTLIFKDDDYRLSFFSGNYITMTNMNDNDIDRIIKYRLSPINISVHATDEKVRCMMLNNRFAGKVLSYIEKLHNSGITMNTQIVLCKGINDGEILDKTIMDLSKYFPSIKCIGIVPVGLTKHRDNEMLLKSLTKDDCINTINIVSKYQKLFKKKYKENVVYLADEFYLKADMDMPLYKEYGDFSNIENGIGMIADFNHEFGNEYKKVIRRLDKDKINENKIKKEVNIETKTIENKFTVTLLTGKITEKFIKEKIEILSKIFKNLDIKVKSIENKFFGNEITVTGLICGQDVIDTIKENNSNLSDKCITYILPNICLKEDEDIFLDDVTLKEVKDVCNNLLLTDNTAKSLINILYKLNKGN